MHGKEQAMTWIKENVGKLPLLTFYKIMSEWKSHSRFYIFPLFFNLFGLIVFFSINPLYARVILGLVIASTVPVAITYSAGGRFLSSIHPIKLALIAIGLWTLIISYIEISLDKLKGRRPPEPESRSIGSSRYFSCKELTGRPFRPCWLPEIYFGHDRRIRSCPGFA